jgi:signal transduction histidine kinase
LAVINKPEYMDVNLGKEFFEAARYKNQIDFINISAHEMQVPLQSVLTYSELLSKEPEKSYLYVEPILRNAKMLQSITRNLLDLSRIENQSIRLNREIFELSELISSTVADIVPGITKNYQNLKIVKPTSHIFVNADKDKITQVLCNLLANAIKFTTDGTISISATKRIEQNDVVVSVKDNGIGIDHTILPLLFSKFISTSPDGLGLGLYITKNIISAHGGKIWAQNNPNGKGATFSFLIPLY